MRRTLVVLALIVAAVAPAAGATAPFTEWCGGSSVSAVDRTPDAVSAFQIHVIYAVPSDGADRFAQLVSSIATDMASMDLWWRNQDATRAPRFDLASFGGCPSTFGQLDVSSVRLPHDAAFYAGNQYALVRDDLGAAGFRDPDKKYLVYYDGPPVPASASTVICGTSDNGIIGGGPLAYSITYLGGFCGATLGSGGPTTVIATHELIHGLGALVIPTNPPGPPNACPGNPGHPCDGPQDVLAPSFGSGVALDSLVLDIGRDDYYGHPGSWWDIQDSPFLARLDSLDTQPPTQPRPFSATSHGPVVTLSWRASTDETGPVAYRVYRDGSLIARTTAPRLVDTATAAGRTYAYAVRASDAAGFLSARSGIRFRVGLGIVDGNGRLVRDTVPPPGVGSVRARATRDAVVLSWRGVTDRGGLRGYRIDRNGTFYSTVTRPSVTIPAARAFAHWAIRAVDRAGNLGAPARIVVR